MSRTARTTSRPVTTASPGVAIECATERIEILVRGRGGEPRAHEVEIVGQGHTRRLAAVLARALERAAVEPRELDWVAADLGPGSFTGVRVGLATAEALALACGGQVVGASSLAALAHGAPPQRALIAPLVPAGRIECYLGLFRCDGGGAVHLCAAPRVLGPEATVEAIEEARRASGLSAVACIGPGVPRWRESLERAFPGATEAEWRFEGLSADDLAVAALLALGPAGGLPARGEEATPLYVRSAQAEERVRHRVAALQPLSIRPMEPADVPPVAAVEQLVFSDPWPEAFFLGELAQRAVYARVAEREGSLAGYSLTWLGAERGHLGNLAVVPAQRRRGVARALLDDLFAEAHRRRVEILTLEVRASNFAAQALYRAHRFRLAGLRRGYYRDTSEDALVMEWKAPRGT
jgi:tRNA threonylcarbamoyl adenosine modification protein YeaZ/ribosomal-protein-alanine acetyltransferase